MSSFFGDLGTKESSDALQQVRHDSFLGSDSCDTFKHPLDLLGDRSLSIFNEGNNSKSEKPISTPTPVSKKRKRNTPVIDVADRRRAVLPKIRYACTRMKIFTTKEKSDFMCGCCYQKYPNKEVAGLVITDSSSLPACLPCSDFVREIIWVLIKAVETGFGEPKDDHPVAQAMKSVRSQSH